MLVHLHPHCNGKAVVATQTVRPTKLKYLLSGSVRKTFADLSLLATEHLRLYPVWPLFTQTG